jgi:hypothetical protein
MTGREYVAYLDSLVTDAANAPTLKVQSAESLFTDAEREAHKAHLAQQGARYADRINDAAHDARERIRNLHGEKAAKLFETIALNIKRAEKFSTESDNEPEWQLPGLIPTTGSGLHTGASGTLKSFAELHIGAQINERGGKALMIVAEGARGYKRRIRAYAQHHGIALEEMPTVLPMAVNLFQPTEVTAFIEAVRVLCSDVTYVSIDTKWRCALGSEENSASDQAKVFAGIDRIAKAFGCFVMCVAHLGKDESKGVRGSNSQYAAVDVELTQRRTGDYCTLTTSKMKDSEDDIEHTFKVVPVQLGFNKHGEPESSLVLEPVEAAEAAVSIKPPKGPTERALWDHAQTLGERFTEDALVNDATDILRKTTNPKALPKNVRRALKGMVGEYFIQHGEELALRVGLIRDNAGWLG